ncbi:MAG: tape measure protein [Bacteroides sp.]|nr:tape measure protein [Bacteroides sp.]
MEKKGMRFFKLTQEQANARLSVKKLRDEYALYKNDGKQVIETTNGIAISWKKALGVIGGAAAINKFISDLVNVRGEFQKTQMSFETMLGSKEKADKLMAQMVETAAKTPFDLQGVADGAKQLLAYGTEAKDVNDTLIRLGNIASGLSIPLGDMVYLYGTTQTQGRLFTQDVRQFMGRGIPLVKELATMLGKTEEEINKMVTAGQIGFPLVEAVIKKMTDEGGKFYNLMQKQSEILSGQISNLGDAWDRMLNSIGEDTQGLTSKTISMATSIVENYETVEKILAGLIVTYGTYRTAVMLVTAAESKHTLVEIGLTNVRVMARKAQLALNAAMLTNPYVLLAVAVGGLITVNLTLLDTTRQLKAVEDDYNKTKDEAIAKEQKLKAETDKNLSVAENYKAATEDRKDALVRLIQKYPAIFEKYKTETEMLQHILDIHKEIDKYEKNKSVTNPQNELANVNKQIADLEKLAKQRYHGGRGLTNAENTKLEMLKNKRSELEGSLKKEETDAILADLTGYSNSQIEAAIKDRERLLAKMQLKGVSKGTITGNSFLSGTFSKEELEGQKKLLEAALVKPSTYKQDLAKAKEDWEKAKKGYETLLNDQKATSEQVKNARDEMQAKEKSYKDLGGITGSSLSKQENQAEKLRQQTEKYNLLLDKQALEQKRSAEDLQMKVDEARIKAMDEGSKKTIAQMELNFEKEMHAIDRQKEDALRKKIEDARAAWEANPKNKGKSFDATGIKLSDDEKKYFNELYKAAIISFEKGKKELSDKQVQAWQEYFIEFGNYQEKRKNLIQKYDDEIAKLQSDSPEYAIKVAEKIKL